MKNTYNEKIQDLSLIKIEMANAEYASAIFDICTELKDCYRSFSNDLNNQFASLTMTEDIDMNPLDINRQEQQGCLTGFRGPPSIISL